SRVLSGCVRAGTAYGARTGERRVCLWLRERVSRPELRRQQLLGGCRLRGRRSEPARPAARNRDAPGTDRARQRTDVGGWRSRIGRTAGHRRGDRAAAGWRGDHRTPRPGEADGTPLTPAETTLFDDRARGTLNRGISSVASVVDGDGHCGRRPRRLFLERPDAADARSTAACRLTGRSGRAA